MSSDSLSLAELIMQRFGAGIDVPEGLADNEALACIARHASHRAFKPDPVADEVTSVLLACALAAPSKSDLQQASIVVVRDAAQRAALGALVPSAPWFATAPLMLVFCADNRRIRRVCALRGRPFANDHLDSFFNASVDAALVLMNFIRAAEAAGLGCCPVSVLRNRIDDASRVLALPAGVFPVAGLAAGYPAATARLRPRLSLATTVHVDRYDDSALPSEIAHYDRRRATTDPLPRDAQRLTERYGYLDGYGWSEDKARQVSEPQRRDFGRFVRSHGFRLD